MGHQKTIGKEQERLRTRADWREGQKEKEKGCNVQVGREEKGEQTKIS